MKPEEAEKRLNDLIEECQRQAEQDRQRQDYTRQRDPRDTADDLVARPR